jgi:phospholipid/cholesterol/gamma-HCH transport system substrate-binding protein
MKKFAKESWVGLFMTVGLICVVYLAVQLGDVSLWGTDSYTLQAGFSEISSLRPGSPVTMMGIDIGQVTAVSIDQEQGQAMVRFRVDNAIRVYSDAIASIKTRGLLGERYLAIDAGGGGTPLKSGDTIWDTEAPVDLTEMIGKYAFGTVKDDPL